MPSQALHVVLQIAVIVVQTSATNICTNQQGNTTLVALESALRGQAVHGMLSGMADYTQLLKARNLSIYTPFIKHPHCREDGAAWRKLALQLSTFHQLGPMPMQALTRSPM